MGQDPAKGIELVRDGKVVPELVDVFKLIRDYDVVLEQPMFPQKKHL